MNVCPLCGAKVAEDDVFCESCGHNLLQEREQEGKSAVEAAAVEPVVPESVEQAVPVTPEEAPTPAAPPTEAPAPEEAPAAAAEEGGFPVPPAEGVGAPARDNTWTWIIVIAIVLLVLLCCCCTATFLFFYLLPAS